MRGFIERQRIFQKRIQHQIKILNKGQKDLERYLYVCLLGRFFYLIIVTKFEIL